MGEKIRDLTKISLGQNKFIIELNEALGKGLEKQIHIQNKHFRFECSESEFYTLAVGIIVAAKKMQKYKETGNIDFLYQNL